MNRRAALALALLPAALAAPATAGPGGGEAPADPYFELDTLTAGVTRSGGRRAVMTVECGIDAPQPDKRLRAEQSIPRLRAALVAVVQRHATVLRPGEPPDVERLLRDLQAAVNEVMGGPGARILLGTVMVV